MDILLIEDTIVYVLNINDKWEIRGVFGEARLGGLLCYFLLNIVSYVSLFNGGWGMLKNTLFALRSQSTSYPGVQVPWVKFSYGTGFILRVNLN